MDLSEVGRDPLKALCCSLKARSGIACRKQASAHFEQRLEWERSCKTVPKILKLFTKAAVADDMLVMSCHVIF